jgi:hypothetical protein
MRSFVDHPKRDCAITMGMVVVWRSTPVCKTVKDWTNEGFQINLVLLIHAPAEQPGQHNPKVLLVGNPNRLDEDETATQMDKILLPRMINLVKYAKKPAWSVWCNKLRAERNWKQASLALVSEWMIEILVGGMRGLGIQRNADEEVIAIEGFHQMEA